MSFVPILLLLAPSVPADTPSRQAVRVIVRSVDRSGGLTQMSVIAERASEDGRPAERSTAELVGGQATLAVPAGPWVISVQGKGLWSPSEPVEVGSGKPGAPLEVLVPVWRAGTVGGRLPAGTRAEVVRVSFDRPAVGDGPPGPRESGGCGVDAGQRFACTLPHGVHNLQLQVPGFVPKYFWEVPVAAGATVEIPPFPLATGASIAGFVGKPEGLKEPATVTLRTLDAEAINGEGDSGRFSAPVTGRRGFFQLAGVPPGQYLLQARLGDLVSAVEQVAVYRDAEAWLREPLTLSRPLALDLTVTPPLAPGGSRWRVTLMRQDGRLSTPIAANAEISETGTWRRQGLAAGPYRVGLADEAGSRWAVRDFELSAGEPVLIAVHGRPIHGSVRLGKDPLEARLMFRGGAARVELSSDERGEFAGHLPLDGPPGGEWQVVVDSSKPPLRRRLGGVHVPEAADAAVELTLPDTLLNVRIMDPAGSPWNEKTILTVVHPKDGAQQLLILPSTPDAPADERDRNVFAFRGLSPGSARLVAKSATAISDEVVVEVKADAPSRASLVMRESLTIKGTVVSVEGQPVPGAQVVAMPAQAPLQGMEEERTNADGTFELRLPRATPAIGLSVAAGGLAYQMVKVPVRLGEDLRLVLRRRGGTLRLSTPEAEAFGRGRVRFLFRGGHLVNTLYLQKWAELNGGGRPEPETLLVPQMEAGPYTLCLLDADAVLPILASGVTPPSCASGELAEGAELSLAVGTESR